MGFLKILDGAVKSIFATRCTYCGSTDTDLHRNSTSYASYHCRSCGRGFVKDLINGHCSRCGSSNFSLRKCRFRDENDWQWTIHCDDCDNWLL